MKALLATTSVVVAYFLLWPVPVDPVAWPAPKNNGYVDPFEQNDFLKAVTGISLGEYLGPEDATLGLDGRLYATTHDGTIVQIQDRAISPFANVGGRPLGIQTDKDGSFVVANAFVGLQRVTREGVITTILGQIDDQPLIFADGVDIGPDGTIYFSNASRKFGAKEYGGTYEASLLDLMEHGDHGSVYAFDPESGEVSELLDKLSFANGVAVSDDGTFVLVVETGRYRILKYWLQGDKTGTTEILIDNLPGFPDNIKRGLNGRFWIGLVAPRNALLDRLSTRPFLRKAAQRLPASMRPAAEPSSHVIAINSGGEVLMNLYDSKIRFPALTGVVEVRDALYLTTLFGHQLPTIAKREL